MSNPFVGFVNRVLTLVWALAFVACAICGVIAQQVDPGAGREWLNWIIPIVLIDGALRFTAWYPEPVTGADQPGEATV